MERHMNFQTALSELCSGQGDVRELSRRNHLTPEQISALQAVSRKFADTPLSSSAFSGMMML